MANKTTARTEVGHRDSVIMTGRRIETAVDGVVQGRGRGVHSDDTIIDVLSRIPLSAKGTIVLGVVNVVAATATRRMVAIAVFTVIALLFSVAAAVSARGTPGIIATRRSRARPIAAR